MVRGSAVRGDRFGAASDVGRSSSRPGLPAAASDLADVGQLYARFGHCGYECELHRDADK